MDTPQRDWLPYQDSRLTAVGTYILCLIPGRAIFWFLWPMFRSRPDRNHGTRSQIIKFRSTWFMPRSFESWGGDQLDRHGRRPCAQNQLLGFNTTQRSSLRSHWDKLSLLPSPPPNPCIISCRPRVRFDFVEWSDSVCTEGYWICWATSCTASRAVSHHAQFRVCLLSSVCQFNGCSRKSQTRSLVIF